MLPYGHGLSAISVVQVRGDDLSHCRITTRKYALSAQVGVANANTLKVASMRCRMRAKTVFAVKPAPVIVECGLVESIKIARVINE
jgi:hypothetical protein